MRTLALAILLPGLWLALSAFTGPGYVFDSPPGWQAKRDKDGDFELKAPDGTMILNVIVIPGLPSKTPPLAEMQRQALPDRDRIAEQRNGFVGGQPCLFTLTHAVNPRNVAIVSRYVMCYMPAAGSGRPTRAFSAFLIAPASISAQSEQVWGNLLRSLRWTAAGR